MNTENVYFFFGFQHVFYPASVPMICIRMALDEEASVEEVSFDMMYYNWNGFTQTMNLMVPLYPTHFHTTKITLTKKLKWVMFGGEDGLLF